MRRARLREGLRRGRSPRLVQGVRALVLLAHPVHDEHDHQYRAEEAHYRAADHSWKHDRNILDLFSDKAFLAFDTFINNYHAVL